MGNTTQIKPSLSEEVGQNLVGTHSIASFFNVPKEPWQLKATSSSSFLWGTVTSKVEESLFHLSCGRHILKNLTFIYLMKMVASSLTFPPSSWPATVEHWFPYQLKVLLMIQQLQAPLSSPKERVSKSLSSLCALRTINSLWWFSCNELIFHILTIGIQTPAGSRIFNPGIFLGS